MSYEHDSYEHHGCTIRIMADDCDRESPREWDNVGTILYGHSHYTLGDVEVHEWEGEFYDAYDREPTSWQDWAKFVIEHKGATKVLPVYAYIHGGVTLSVGDSMDTGNPFSCQWDSGLAGIIFDTEDGRRICGTPEDRIEAVLKSEIKTFDQYLTGDVYGYIVETPDDSSWVGDSCWGFYDREYCESEAKGQAEWYAKRQIQEDAKFRACMAL